MCGIAGIVSRGKTEPFAVAQMCEAIKHRGPDDHGTKVWSDHGIGLGHRRLSIIDLSAAGRNPMGNEDGSVWIVFNGEIYNCGDLRRELESAGHEFHSQSDTEVVIHAYEEWGDKHVTHLRGMFAYAIYDRRGTATVTEGRTGDFRLFMARDRFGIKPLFYYWHAGELLFASEIRAVLALSDVDRAVDRSALFDYLTYWYIPTPKTAYKHIRKLPAGHYLVCENHRVRTRQYWDLDLHRPSPVKTEREAAELVQGALADAVRSHMLSDVPIGVFLSGGLDSSTITALMSRASSDPVRTFSIGFDVAAHSETSFARLIAQRYHTEHCEKTVGADSIRSMLPLFLRLYGEPYADGSAVPTYHVSEHASEHVKVVLSGDGGDEVFWGYNWYSSWLSRHAITSRVPSVCRPFFRFTSRHWPYGWRGHGLIADLARLPLEQYAHRLEMFSPDQKRQIAAGEWGREFSDYDDYWYFRQFWRSDVDPITRVQYLDVKTYLADDILTKVDRASMAVSLEVRPPLLDHLLVETVFSLPTILRVPSGEKKHLLKQAARDLLPAEIISRPKKGFSAPWVHWLQSEREWVERVLRTDGDSTWLNTTLFDLPWIADGGPRLLGILVLGEWLRSEQGNSR